MSKTAAPGITTIGAFKLTPAGLKVEGKPTFDQWSDAVAEIKAVGACLMWVIGDLLIYGEERFGERYTQALEAADYANSTIRVAQWVARKFPPEKRFPALHFAIHQEVAALDDDEATRILQRAEEESLGKRQVRELVLAAKVANTELPPVVSRLTETDDDVSRLTTDDEAADNAPAFVSEDPEKCDELVSKILKTLTKLRAQFSAIMATPFGEAANNAAGGYHGCKLSKTGETVEAGQLGPITFGPPEYTCQAIEELRGFCGGIRAMLSEVGREKPEDVIAPWER